MSAENVKFKIAYAKMLTCMEIDNFNIAKFLDFIFEFSDTRFAAFVPVAAVSVSDGREVVVYRLNVNLVTLKIKDIHKFADMVIVSVREEPACNNRLFAACLLLQKFAYSEIRFFSFISRIKYKISCVLPTANDGITTFPPFENVSFKMRVNSPI